MKDIILSDQAVALLLGATSAAMKSSIELFGDREGWQECAGGALCIAHPYTGLFHYVGLVGSPSSEKVPKYIAICQEKARRLALNQSHFSSWQSRNPPHQWGGAIKCPDVILSFSGLPELGDEAIMLAAAKICASSMRTITGGRSIVETDLFLNSIAKMSGNQFWPALRDR